MPKPYPNQDISNSDTIAYDPAWFGGGHDLPPTVPNASDATVVRGAAGRPPGDAASAARQIVFIEGNVPDAALLAQGVAPGVTAVILDPQQDGVEQIADYLAAHHVSNLAGIDIVAHGADGSLSLGTAELDSATLGQYGAQLSTIGAALAPGGAIQLYGCDVAQDASGVAFLQQLSQAAGGADVAAASHLVGAASGGGSWTLNVDVGTVDTSAPFTAAAEAAYQGELSAPTDQLVYWAGEDASANGSAIRVEQISVTGTTVSNPTRIADSASNSNLNYNPPGQVALDTPQDKYFLAENSSSSNSANVIVEGSLGGGSPTVVYTDPFSSNPGNSTIGQIGGVAVDPLNGEVYFSQLAYDANTGAAIAADTGIYEAKIGSGGALQVSMLTSTSNNLVNPLAVAVDPTANLLFFIDSFAAGAAPEANNVYEVNLSTGAMSMLYSFSNSDPYLTLDDLAVDPTNNTIFVSTQEYNYNLDSPLDTPTSSSNSIVSIKFSTSGSGTSATATAGAVNTLYSGSAADLPYSVAVDPATEALYVGGIAGPASGTFYGAVYEGNETGSVPLTQITSTSTIDGSSVGADSRLYSMAIIGNPTITAGATVTVHAGLGPVVADGALTVTDADDVIANATVSGVLSGDTLSLNNGSALAFSDGGTISSSFSNGTLVLSGNASAADYTTALDEVEISTTNTTPNARTLTWTVSNGVNAAEDTSTVLCFCRGTGIATPHGEVLVEHLRVGDTVLTAGGDVRPITWIGVGRVLAPMGRRTAATPVIVQANAIAPGVPYRDLRVTKGHAFLLDDVLIPVEFLVNHRSIHWEDRGQEVQLYHIELDRHDVLLANGAPAESYRDDGNRWLFQNANTGWDLPPQPPCAPVLTGGPVVDAVWRRLLERASPTGPGALTDDPDLHLLVDGAELEPVAVHGDVYEFRVPAHPGSVRIRSRSAEPQLLGTARDPRRLGVAVRRIELHQPGWDTIIRADDAGLTDGYHDYEPDNSIRWTDGDAEIPADRFIGLNQPWKLLLHLGGQTWYADRRAGSRAA